MKPVNLLMQAFGPYGDEVPEINFEQFEEKGLFLICGDTGAGKTTIFDAICFALYGTTSSLYRDTKNLRSDYAGDDVESFVDFISPIRENPFTSDVSRRTLERSSAEKALRSRRKRPCSTRRERLRWKVSTR